MIGAQTQAHTAHLRPTDAPSAHTISFQLLWHHVTIGLPDDATFDHFPFLVNRAEHGFEPRLTLRYRVEGSERDGYRIFEEGDLLAVVPLSSHVLDWVYSRVYLRVWDHVSLAGWVRIHGACVDLPEGRVLLVGDSGAGKSSSTIRLALAGATVGSDESTLVRDGIVVGVPRRFHVKEGTEAYIPEIADAMQTVATAWNGTLQALDPTAIGAHWRVEPRRIDVLCCLESVDGEPSVERIDSGAAMGMMVRQIFRAWEARTDIVRELVRLLAGTRSIRVRGAGSLDLSSVLSGVLLEHRAEVGGDHRG